MLILHNYPTVTSFVMCRLNLDPWIAEVEQLLQVMVQLN
jgi:hypothetical protein